MGAPRWVIGAAVASVGATLLLSPAANASDRDLVPLDFFSIVGTVTPATADGTTIAPTEPDGAAAIPLQCATNQATVPAFFFDLSIVGSPAPTSLWLKVASASPSSGSVVPVVTLSDSDPKSDPAAIYARTANGTALAPIDPGGWSAGSWAKIDLSAAVPKDTATGFLSVTLFPANPQNPADLPYSPCGSYELGSPVLREAGDNSEPDISMVPIEPEEVAAPFVKAKVRGTSIKASMGGDYGGKKRWRLMLQRKAGKWRNEAKKTITPPKKVVFKNLPKGKYRVLLAKQAGFPADKTGTLRVK